MLLKRTDRCVVSEQAALNFHVKIFAKLSGDGQRHKRVDTKSSPLNGINQLRVININLSSDDVHDLANESTCSSWSLSLWLFSRLCNLLSLGLFHCDWCSDRFWSSWLWCSNSLGSSGTCLLWRWQHHVHQCLGDALEAQATKNTDNFFVGVHDVYISSPHLAGTDRLHTNPAVVGLVMFESLR